jgi:hypothetical protein
MPWFRFFGACRFQRLRLVHMQLLRLLQECQIPRGRNCPIIRDSKLQLKIDC